MNIRWTFASVALLAVLAGAGLWQLNRPGPRIDAVELAPGAIYSMTFSDPAGGARSMEALRGRFVVLNFWATWCAPCREEMPGFSRLQAKWQAGNVRFVGITGDDRHAVERFLEQLPVSYPVFLAGSDAESWARRLGDRDAVLPFTVLIDPEGRIVGQKVGIYSEGALDAELRSRVGDPR